MARVESKYDKELSSKKIIMTEATCNISLAHSHNFLELAYLVSGKASHILSGKEQIIKKGDYFIVDFKAVHSYKNISNEPLIVVNCLFLPKFLDSTLTGCKSFQQVVDHYLIKFSYHTLQDKPTQRIYHDNDGTVLKLIRQMQKEHRTKSAGYNELLRCYLIEIIIMTMRTISRAKTIATDSDIVRYILDYVDEHYMQPIKLCDMASQMDYSLTYLSKKFKDETGVSFKDYLQNLRIRNACRLISNSNKKIDEIAFLVGYTDVKFFTEVFKKRMGITPGRFKMIHRN
jgi:transcriptional regulator, araC family